MKEPRTDPYIWVTWLTKLMSGENQCVWASWFRSHFKYDKLPSDFDLAKWTAEHNQMLQGRVEYYKENGHTVYTEDQNKFKLVGKQGEILAGKADIVAIGNGDTIVEDCKTGQPRNSDHMQVLIYMLVLPFSVNHCRDRILNGVVRYSKDEVKIPDEKIDQTLKDLLRDKIHVVGGVDEPPQIPSYAECRFCDISKEYCAKRIEQAPKAVSDHGLF